MSRSQKQKERLDADRQVNKEENVIQAAAGSMELSKRCELRNAERVLLHCGWSLFICRPPPTHTHSQSRCSSQVVSNDGNDSHRKPLETDWKGDESSLAEVFHGSPAMAPEVEPGVL